MDHMTIAVMSVGVGIIVAIVSVIVSMTATGVRRVAKRMQTAGRDLCAICGRPIPRHQVYCRDHQHLAALRRRRPMDECGRLV
jgi:hypothetical protein